MLIDAIDVVVQVIVMVAISVEVVLVLGTPVMDMVLDNIVPEVPIGWEDEDIGYLQDIVTLIQEMVTLLSVKVSKGSVWIVALIDVLGDVLP